jgi:haloalkane dehalogenase
MTESTGAADHTATPPWVPQDLYPFEGDYADIDGARVHYVDEGSGPPLLLLHGNPTWSFLYRELIKALSDRFRCIAPDYPGFGLSTAPPGYGYTPAEHARVLEQLILRLDLHGVTMMVQDWGGPIGFAAATRHPDRFARFIVGNTWAWPKSDPGTQLFARVLGGRVGAS